MTVSITDAERQIMEVLWNKHPVSAEEIIEALAGTTDWRTGTIKALLNRMLKKGSVTATAQGRRYLYEPAVSRRECMGRDSQRLLDRWFDGRLAPLVAHLSNTDSLTRKELAELRQLMDKLSDDD
jgi:BlaI family transcriptional regulator, penicillinase repressor